MRGSESPEGNVSMTEALDASAPSPKRVVLVVEDYEPTAQLMATIVEDIDPTISAHIVGTGHHCLTVLRGEGDSVPQPDLVLLDLKIPVGDGVTVLETRSEDPSIPDIPVIVVSNRGDEETIEECYEKGAEDYIQKPGDLDGYREEIGTAIESWMPADETSVQID